MPKRPESNGKCGVIGQEDSTVALCLSSAGRNKASQAHQVEGNSLLGGGLSLAAASRPTSPDP